MNSMDVQRLPVACGKSDSPSQFVMSCRGEILGHSSGLNIHSECYRTFDFLGAPVQPLKSDASISDERQIRLVGQLVIVFFVSIGMSSHLTRLPNPTLNMTSMWSINTLCFARANMPKIFIAPLRWAFSKAFFEPRSRLDTIPSSDWNTHTINLPQFSNHVLMNTILNHQDAHHFFQT